MNFILAFLLSLALYNVEIGDRVQRQCYCCFINPINFW